jgi:sigma-B regulation protein RsbU (phosphoserine phosphatase)
LEIAAAAGHAVTLPEGAAWLEPLPAERGTWLQLGPGRLDAATRAARARAAALVAGRLLASERENGQVAGELANRYEEISLLYSISDILGRTVQLDEAARTIVGEVALVVGAQRASIMVHDPASDTLRLVAAYGVDLSQMSPVPVADPLSVAARVFRSQVPLGIDDVEALGASRAEPREYRKRAFLSVPILYGGADGAQRPVGVINLTDRDGDDAFSAGDRKLVTAIATQIGAAIENSRLVDLERKRARLDTELAVAQQLQLALLPTAALLSKAGDVGVRFQSAETVSGDFYRVVLHGRSSVGVFIGDVMSHGFAAALVMAHTLSALGILAQQTATPEEAIQRLRDEVGDELERAEMSMTLFYGVIHHERRTLRYANAGHPQAFVVSREGGPAKRLGATAPPLGLAAAGEAIGGAEVPWHPGKDLLCLFTDGLSEARNAAEEAFGERRLLDVVVRNCAKPSQQIVDLVFAELERFTPAVQDDRTLLLMRR